ncbi:MAG: hypothetical protein AAFX94_08565 [Myxococcota bacterium]
MRRLSELSIALLLLGGCATLRSNTAKDGAKPLTMTVEVDPSDRAPLWVRFTNQSREDLEFGVKTAVRILEDRTVVHEYAQPAFPLGCEQSVEESVYRLEPGATFALRLDVPRPSPLAHRVLVSANVAICDDSSYRYRVYAEAPLSPPQLATRSRL